MCRVAQCWLKKSRPNSLGPKIVLDLEEESFLFEDSPEPQHSHRRDIIEKHRPCSHRHSLQCTARWLSSCRCLSGSHDIDLVQIFGNRPSPTRRLPPKTIFEEVNILPKVKTFSECYDFLKMLLSFPCLYVQGKKRKSKLDSLAAMRL